MKKSVDMYNFLKKANGIFLIIGFSLGIVFLYLVFKESDPGAIARTGVFVSVSLVAVRILRGGKSGYIIAYLLSLLFLAIILVSVKIKVFSFILQFTVLLAAALWVPYLLIMLIYRLPIKNVYKKAFLCSLLPILSVLIFGRWGNAIQTLTTILIVIPLFYIVTRNSTIKERWICYCVFVIVFTLFMILFGSFEYIAFPVLAYSLFLLLTSLLSPFLSKMRNGWLFVILLMLLSCPVSYFGSLNSFYYLVAKDNGHAEKGSPLSYTIVVNECDTLNEKMMQGKNIALFFWSTHCANCHKEFPSFSKLTAEYKLDSTKVFIAAFVSFEEEDALYYEREIEQAFAFEWAKVVDGKQIMNDLGFNSFPHLTVLDESGLVVYNGPFVNRKGVFVNRVQKYLN